MDFSIKCAYAHGTSALRTHLINMSPKQTELTWPVFAELRKRWAGKVRRGGRVRTHSLIPSPYPWQRATRSRRHCSPGRRWQRASSKATILRLQVVRRAPGFVASLHPVRVGGRVARAEAVREAASMQGRRTGGSERAAKGVARSQAAPKLRGRSGAQGLGPRRCCAAPRPTAWRAACAGPGCSL